MLTLRNASYFSGGDLNGLRWLRPPSLRLRRAREIIVGAFCKSLLEIYLCDTFSGKWPVRLTVRTSDFHSGNRSSILLRATYPFFKPLIVKILAVFFFDRSRLGLRKDNCQVILPPLKQSLIREMPIILDLNYPKLQR